MPETDFHELTNFTHSVGGDIYGGWFRIVTAGELEVLGVGLLETVPFAGFDAQSVARSVLEEFVRRRARSGSPVPPVAKVSRPNDNTHEHLTPRG